MPSYRACERDLAVHLLWNSSRHSLLFCMLEGVVNMSYSFEATDTLYDRSHDITQYIKKWLPVST